MTDDELIEYTDRAITELVYPKWDLQKAYNYYNGKRDAEQYRYLEENYGIGNPTSVEFIPLIRKHIDALVGEYLGTPIIPRVSCKDSATVSKITREKQLKISQSVFSFLQSRLKNKIIDSMSTGQPMSDPAIQQDLDDLIEDLNYGFQSEYEIAAQNVIQYLLQSRDTDIHTKLKTLLLDLLITGYTFYRTKPTVGNNNVQIEILSPLNTFIDRNPNSPYVKDSYRVVVRKWLTKTEILNQYGRDLSKEDIKVIKDSWEYGQDYSRIYVRSFNKSNGTPATNGLQAGVELVPGYPDQANIHNYNLIPVYEVEWLDTDKKFVMQRYKSIRIGENIHILYGKDEEVIRSQDNPTYCTLSVNGLYFLNRVSEPYSLVMACDKLQDKYDILHFYRDNLIANSGTAGDWIDVSMLPKFLGSKLSERLQKWQAYKKSGIALIDSSQEGRLGSGQAPINTIYNGFDDSVKAQAIQAIQLAIDSVEQTCSSITGVFRERLNGIQQRDAVTNVQTSVNNSFTISKQWYQQLDCLTEEILTDALNQAKIVYKNGITGTLILGDKQQKVFTSLPEYFTMTDYDIHILNSTDVVRDTEQLRALLPEFIKSGTMTPDIIVDAATTKSLSQLKQQIRTAMRKQEKKNDQLQQASQQIQQLQQQLTQTQKQLQEVSNKAEQLNAQKLQIEAQKIESDAKIKMYQAQTDRNYKEAVVENDTRRTQIEIDQLHDGNPYNDKVVDQV